MCPIESGLPSLREPTRQLSPSCTLQGPTADGLVPRPLLKRVLLNASITAQKRDPRAWAGGCNHTNMVRRHGSLQAGLAGQHYDVCLWALGARLQRCLFSCRSSPSQRCQSHLHDTFAGRRSVLRPSTLASLDCLRNSKGERVDIAKSVIKRDWAQRPTNSFAIPDRGAGSFSGAVKPRIGAKIRCVAGRKKTAVRSKSNLGWRDSGLLERC